MLVTIQKIFQAFWLGMFATSGSVARVAGPLLGKDQKNSFN